MLNSSYPFEIGVMKQDNFVQSDAGPRKGRSPAIVVLSLLAFVLVVMSGVYATIPAKQREAPVPDPTVQAIHDLQTSLLQALDQLKALQETVPSGQAETKRLSEQVNALAGKLEALKQSFAGAEHAPAAVVPIEPEPARPKRGSR
jgi:septal ring factor EnvC (AmiA/AmiB activator)